MIFNKKPKQVDAMQFTSVDDIDPILAFIETKDEVYVKNAKDKSVSIVINTETDRQIINLTDWIVKEDGAYFRYDNTTFNSAFVAQV